MQLGHRSPPGSARSSSGRKRRFKHLNIEQGINNNNIAPDRHLVVIRINITRSVMAIPPHRRAANYPLLPPDTAHTGDFPRGVGHRVENGWGLTKVAVVLLNGLIW